MSIRVALTSLIAGKIVVGVAGHGVLAQLIPSTGDFGPGLAYSSLSFPADNGKEIRVFITTQPTLGTLYVFEDTSFIYTGPNGTHTFQYQVYVDGVPLGDPQPGTINVGVTTVSSDSAQIYTTFAQVEIDATQVYFASSLVNGDTTQTYAAFITSSGSVSSDSVQGYVAIGIVSIDSAQAYQGYITADYDSAQIYVALAQVSVDAAQSYIALAQGGLSLQHAAWLEALARANGLIDTLSVSPTQRSDGTLVQTITEANGTVTINTTAAPTGAAGISSLTVNQAIWLERLVRHHGIIAPLVVTELGETDGTLVLSTTTSAGVTTVALV